MTQADKKTQHFWWSHSTQIGCKSMCRCYSNRLWASKRPCWAASHWKAQREHVSPCFAGSKQESPTAQRPLCDGSHFTAAYVSKMKVQLIFLVLKQTLRSVFLQEAEFTTCAYTCFFYMLASIKLYCLFAVLVSIQFCLRKIQIYEDAGTVERTYYHSFKSWVMPELSLTTVGRQCKQIRWSTVAGFRGKTQ